MAHVSLFIGGIRPLPESGRPTGMYKQPATGPLELGSDGFVGDEQADRRVHGGPEKAVHLYPARHYTQLAERFPEAAPLLVIDITHWIRDDLKFNGLTPLVEQIHRDCARIEQLCTTMKAHA